MRAMKVTVDMDPGDAEYGPMPDIAEVHMHLGCAVISGAAAFGEVVDLGEDEWGICYGCEGTVGSEAARIADFYAEASHADAVGRAW